MGKIFGLWLTILVASANGSWAQEIPTQKSSPMVKVPAGEFWMGCDMQTDPDCKKNEQPRHAVFLDDYEIDRNEVTFGQYTQCVQERICQKPVAGKYRYFKISEQENHPINGVSWFQAKTYCEWLGKRLPTEAEWEKAARGIDGRKFPWKETDLPQSNSSQLTEQVLTISPVCSRPEENSPYGICDLSGNVWEWVEDWRSADYSSAERKNPTGPKKGKNKVLRGGSWLSLLEHRRTTFRGKALPEFQSAAVGFRCAKSLPNPPSP